VALGLGTTIAIKVRSKSADP